MDDTSRSPQEKKALSYARDGRCSYGESNKGARKTVPRRKAGENRRDRHKVHAASADLASPDEARADLAESSARHGTNRVGGWRKTRDARLGAFMRQQQAKRLARAFRRRPKPGGAAQD